MQYPIKPQKIKAKHAQILWWNWVLITYFVICSTKFSDTLLVALILAGFGVLKGSLMVPVGTMGSFWPGLGKCMGCVQSRELGAGDLPFRVYPAGRLLWLPFVADFAVLGGGGNGWCINNGFFLAWVSPFRAVGSIWAVSKVESLPRACAPCHPKRILLGSFSDTLLVVSILDIIYDCHL